MSNIDAMNSQPNLAYLAKELFTELNSKSAEVIAGGYTYGFPIKINFRNAQNLYSLYAASGDTINLATNTISSKGYSKFSASIVNIDTGRLNKKIVDIGSDTTTWTNLRGGNYLIVLQDPDSDIISGNATINRFILA